MVVWISYRRFVCQMPKQSNNQCIGTNVKWSSAPWQPFCFSLSKFLILLFTIEGSQLIRKNIGLWTIFIAVAITVPVSQHKQTNKQTNMITTLLWSHFICHPLHHAAVKATSNYRLCQNLCYVQIGSTLRSFVLYIHMSMKWWILSSPWWYAPPPPY